MLSKLTSPIMKRTCLSSEEKIISKVFKESIFFERTHKAFPKSLFSENLFTDPIDKDLERLRRKDAETKKIIEDAKLSQK